VAVPAGDETAFTDTATASTVLVNDAKVGSDGERSKSVKPPKVVEADKAPGEPPPDPVKVPEKVRVPKTPFAL
jgi:hypothetical protein